jgi:hypothetical protein
MRTPKCITKAPAGSWIGHEYSSICPFNSDNTRLLLIHVDHFELYDGDGNHLKSTPLSPTSEPRWSRKDPNLIYYRAKNEVRSFDTKTDVSTTLHTFPAYEEVYGQGESDISEDGDHLVLLGNKHAVFVYDVKKDRVSDIHLWDAPIGQLYITPENNVLVGDARGVHLLERNTLRKLRTVALTQAHQSVARDTNGEEVLIRINAADPSGDLIVSCPNGIEKVPLKGGVPSCLWSVGWKPHAEGGGAASQAVHISCPDRKGWALISTYSPKNADPSRVYRVRFDMGGAELLCETGSVMIRNPNEGTIYYNPQPKASVSRDGSRFVLSSNAGILDRGGDYTDVYIVKLEDPKPEPAPASITDGEEIRIDYSPFVGQEFVMRPRPDGAVDIFHRKKKGK